VCILRECENVEVIYMKRGCVHMERECVAMYIYGERVFGERVCVCVCVCVCERERGGHICLDLF